MKSKKTNLKLLTYISQFAINMLVPIFLCSYAGYYIDSKLGTNWCFIVLFFVGAAAGARNIFILARKEFRSERDEKKD